MVVISHRANYANGKVYIFGGGHAIDGENYWQNGDLIIFDTGTQSSSLS
jgi:hypothetical protein